MVRAEDMKLFIFNLSTFIRKLKLIKLTGFIEDKGT